MPSTSLVSEINTVGSLTKLAICPEDSMRRIAELIERVSRCRSILIFGETGSGKEIVAQALHERGPRSQMPLIVVNCANQSKELMASELFGHERGAFTGATEKHIGLFEIANGGTLFFDEIGELPLDFQPRLLRALETMTFNRVGGATCLKADVQIISATNRDLVKMVREGTFREDLYHRMHVLDIKVPPLRDRPNDIRYFADLFVKEFSSGKSVVTEECHKALAEYPWPGNVRELRNVIERATYMANGDSQIRIYNLLLPSGEGMTRDEFSCSLTANSRLAELVDVAVERGLNEAITFFERVAAKEALKRSGGKHIIAAKSLGVSKVSFRRLIKEEE